MAQGKVEICGVNTSKLPLLKEEEKDALFLRIKAGDMEAKEEYIKGNLRLVLSVIKRFSNSNENPDDLFQVGCIGLMKAIDNFDLSQGVKFSIYAREAFIKKNNREPSVVEVAGEIGISKEDIVFAMDAIQSPVSLYEPVYTEGGDKLCIMDQVRDPKNTEAAWVENIALQEAINKLGDRERKIIEMRFYQGKTQMEVASELSISQAQISRIEKNALKSMRNYLQM